MTGGRCEHDTLTLASGGFYVLCNVCGAQWCCERVGLPEDTTDNRRRAMGYTDDPPMVGIWGDRIKP